MTSPDPVHRSPAAAWSYLVERGDIELSGRDEGLDDTIRRKLDPTAPMLESALEVTSMESFARAFFEAVHPYVEMMKDICDLFEKAGATQGQAHWALKLDNVDVSLEHFRKWIESWTNVRVTLMVPAIDWQGAWALWRAMQHNERVQNAIRTPFDSRDRNPNPDVRRWMDAYQKGRYEPLPNHLEPTRCPEPLRPVAGVLWAAISKLRDRRLTREELLDQWRAAGRPQDRADGLDLGSIAQNETDFWLLSSVSALATACELTEAKVEQVGVAVNEALSRYPNRPIDAEVSLSHLESIVSLPVWRKRYELFAVWVACQLAEGLDRAGHSYQLHHDNGRMEFAFRETHIATVLSSIPTFTLISERRSSLIDPRGHGRTGNVQPDYGFWLDDGPNGTCRLVVECKHYKRPAARRFADVLDDYARALPEADVFLVNDGPTGNIANQISEPTRSRCHTIEKLMPSHWEARERLWEAVRECVGQPMVRWSANGSDARTALALDVSPSMRIALNSPDIRSTVKQLATEYGATLLAAIDTDIQGRWVPADTTYDLALSTRGSSTELSQPTLQLLRDVDRVIVVTDEEGLRTLEQLTPTQVQLVGLSRELRVVVCARPGGR